MKKLLLLAILATTMIFNVQAQVYKTIHVTTAGTLGSLLTPDEKYYVTNLTVTGNIDARDFVIMAGYMNNLTALDISAVTIQAYNGSAGYQYPPKSYAANEIPGTSENWGSPLKSITLPNSITSIGDNAFESSTSSGLKGLTSINIPNGVKTIGQGAFAGCTGLTSISLPSSVTSIGGGAFGSCTGLTSASLPNSVTSIGQMAFYGCTGLTSVNIPNGVIGVSAFSGCSGLSTISFGSGVTSIGNNAFSQCNGLINLTIPGSITSIEAAAFSNCNSLTTLNIGSGVTSIGGSAFAACTRLTNVTIPNSVTSIGAHAFDGCSGLTSITIGSGVTFIAGSTFLGCTGLTNVTIPNSVTSIVGLAFYGCSGLTSVTIGSGVTSISDYAFAYCSKITTITLGSGVTSIGARAFQDCRALKIINSLNATPPTLTPDLLYMSDYTQNPVTDVYVPTDAAVVAYKANTNWINTFPGNIIKKITLAVAPTITSFTPTSGASGTTITITGTNLTGTSAVSIGGTSAGSVTVVNSTTVTAVVGIGTTGTISLTTPGGTAVSSGTFTFIPAISGVTQNLLTNPSFETWSAGVPTAWTLTSTVGGTVIQSSTTLTGSGSAFQIAGPTGTYMISQNVVPPEGASTFDTNTTYKLSVSYLVTAGDGTDARIWSGLVSSAAGVTPLTYYVVPATHADSLLYYIPLHGPGGNIIPSPGTYGNDQNGYLLDNHSSGIWHTYTYSFKFPAGIMQFNFMMRTYSTSTVIWDNLYFGVDTSPYSDVKTVNSDNAKLISGKSFIRAEFDGNAKIEVYNLSGLLLKQANATNNISIDNLKTGLYIVKINGTAYKVVVE